MFLPPASLGKEMGKPGSRARRHWGSPWETCMKAAPQNTPERAHRPANMVLGPGLDCAKQQSHHRSMHPPSALQTASHPQTPPAPGTLPLGTQHSVLRISAGTGCSSASLLQTQQNTHTNREQ